jgi:hypothetical protein
MEMRSNNKKDVSNTNSKGNAVPAANKPSIQILDQTKAKPDLNPEEDIPKSQVTIPRKGAVKKVDKVNTDLSRELEKVKSSLGL